MPERFSFDRTFVSKAVQNATEIILANLSEYVHMYPTAASENLKYGKQKNAEDW